MSIDMTARYQRAQQMLQGAGFDPRHRKFALNAQLNPHWINNSDCFWYQRETLQGHQYRLVDASEQSNQILCDHQALAQALAAAADTDPDPEQLPLANLTVALSPLRLTFTAFEKDWCYTPETASCTVIKRQPAHWVISPDGRYAAFTRDNNLYISELATGVERALTTDGERFWPYAGPYQAWGDWYQVIDVLWSPDSKRLLTQRVDSREVQSTPVVEQVPLDGSLRPTLNRAGRRDEFPGDTATLAFELYSIDIESGAITAMDYAPCPLNHAPYAGYFPSGRAWWDNDQRHVYCIYQDAGMQETGTRLLRWDTFTGQARQHISEDPQQPITLFRESQSHVCCGPLAGSDEMIWHSDRSGWYHLYRYQQSTGELIGAITEGDWSVNSILHYDARQRELIITTCGRVAGRNPSYVDICRLHIDTGELTPLTDSDHNYDFLYCATNTSWADRAQTCSPCGQYLVTTYSRVNEVPVSLLLDRQGQTLLTLETADTSQLPAQWQWPEPTTTLAADGHTEIHGVIYRPSDFEPQLSYPILDVSWNMQVPTKAFYDCGGGDFFSPMAWAELGFIVVRFNNRGSSFCGSGFRDHSFRHYSNPDLPHFNLADSVAGIKQLAARHPYMDSERVGVTDMHFTPAALTGLLVYPELYKVGVSYGPELESITSAMIHKGGSHPAFEDFADKLEGKLLLIHGMLDSAFPVAGTFRVAEALQQARKNYDMLLLPTAGYGGSDYGQKRAWDYMVTHLLGETPPQDFELDSGLRHLYQWMLS